MPVNLLLLIGAMVFGADAEETHGAVQIVLYCLSALMLVLIVAIYIFQPTKRK